MWCKEKGYKIENVAGDGNCLYASLGRSSKLTGNKVRQIIHDRSDDFWRIHMEHAVDESELEKFKKQALDTTEWGGLEQIVMWSRIYCIKIEIYCYSMDMQTVDGDEFIHAKECIRLLYCNK
eukprot:7421459-Heterocapsa_arctica.AAC.1